MNEEETTYLKGEKTKRKQKERNEDRSKRVLVESSKRFGKSHVPVDNPARFVFCSGGVRDNTK